MLPCYPSSCFLSHFFILLLSASIFPHSGIFVGAVVANTNTFEPWLCLKKGSYVQWWQELISNFLHNDCIISSDSGNLAYITEAAGGCRSGWQLSSPEAPLTEIRERMKEKCTLSLFTDAVSIRNWPCPLENSRFEPISWIETNVLLGLYECVYSVYSKRVSGSWCFVSAHIWCFYLASLNTFLAEILTVYFYTEHIFVYLTTPASGSHFKGLFSGKGAGKPACQGLLME